VFLYSCLSYPTCKSHLFCVVLYRPLWPVWLYHITPNFLISGRILERNIEQKVCFHFLYNIGLKNFPFWEEFTEILSSMCIGLHVKYPLFMSGFNQNWTFRADFRKILKHKISCKSIQWEPSCSMRTHRHDEINNRFSHICERAYVSLSHYANTSKHVTLRSDFSNPKTLCLSVLIFSHRWRYTCEWHNVTSKLVRGATTRFEAFHELLALPKKIKIDQVNFSKTKSLVTLTLWSSSWISNGTGT
jgi:hypothetical protein